MEFQTQSEELLDVLVLKLVKEPTLTFTYSQAKAIIETKTSVEELNTFIVQMAQQGLAYEVSKIAILTYFNIKWEGILTAIQQQQQP